METKSTRGFASMSKERQREIASMGGRAAHRNGEAHEFTAVEAADAGRKGGERVKELRGVDYLRELGGRGGAARAARLKANREDFEQRADKVLDNTMRLARITADKWPWIAE